MTQVEDYVSRRARRAGPDSDTRPGGPVVPPRAAAHQVSGPGQPGHDRRGSHATTYGQGFSWVLVWTIVGSLIPGTGLVAAGSRRLGGFVLFLLGLGLAGLAAAALLGDVLKRALSLALDTNKLLIIAVVVVVIALLWAAVILLTHSHLRRYATLSSGQRAFSGLVVVALLAAVAIPAYKVTSYALIQRDLVNSLTTNSETQTVGSAPNHKKADPWAGTPRVNVLMIGSDAGADRTGVRPDTLILSSINTRTGNTVLFSLPRNLQRVPFPAGTGGAKAWPNGFYCPERGIANACLLNAIWTWAEGDGKSYYPGIKHPGLLATEQAVQGVTGLKPDTYVMLNLRGFSQFINAVGGLRVNVNERLPIGGSSEDPVARGWIEKGKNQLLNGTQTLWYARSRWSTSDYDRMLRQRCVIGDVVNQVNPVMMLKKFPSLAATAKTNIETGINKQDLQAWVTLSLRVKKGKVTSLAFTREVLGSTVDPDYAQIHELTQKALRDSAKSSTKATPSVSTPSAGTPSAGTTPSTTKTPATTNSQTAQSVKDVC